LVKILRGRQLTYFLRNKMIRWKEPMLQRDLVEFRRERPTKPCSLESVKVISDRTAADIKTLGNLSG
jgi:hypothetical protein